MGDSKVTSPSNNGGDRRMGIERRQFSYSNHIPERRCGEDQRNSGDRRSGIDRRSGYDRRSGEDRRSGTDRRGGMTFL
jgi:hypothetical protein